MPKLFCRNVFNERFVRIEADQHERTSCLLNKNCGKTAPTRATTNKLKAALDEIPTAKCSFAEKSKQNHRKSPIFRLTLRLFRAGKQRNWNKVTHLETGFSEYFDEKYVFFSFEKNCFCCHDKRKLLNSKISICVLCIIVIYLFIEFHSAIPGSVADDTRS